MAELGRMEYGRIEVQPVAIERFGTTFGLVPRAPEDEDDVWGRTATRQLHGIPQPWDSGKYDT